MLVVLRIVLAVTAVWNRNVVIAAADGRVLFLLQYADHRVDNAADVQWLVYGAFTRIERLFDLVSNHSHVGAGHIFRGGKKYVVFLAAVVDPCIAGVVP